MNTETITELDEETAFDPSEFFTNEEVEATFDEVIEAVSEESSDDEEPSFDPTDYFSEEILENNGETNSGSKVDHPAPTSEEDEAIIESIFDFGSEENSSTEDFPMETSTIDFPVCTMPEHREYVPPKFEDLNLEITSEPTEEEIESQRVEDLTNRFGFNYKTNQPVMFNGNNLDYEITHELFSIAAATLFIDTNKGNYKYFYTGEVSSPIKIVKDFAEYQKKLKAIADEFIDFPEYLDSVPSSGAIALLIKEYENVGFVTLPGKQDYKLGYYKSYGVYNIASIYKKDLKNLIYVYAQDHISEINVDKVIDRLENMPLHHVQLIDTPFCRQSPMFRDCLFREMYNRCNREEFQNRHIRRLLFKR